MDRYFHRIVSTFRSYQQPSIFLRNFQRTLLSKTKGHYFRTLRRRGGGGGGGWGEGEGEFASNSAERKGRGV